MQKRAKSIMIQGTGSGVGKSIIAAAFCRIFKDKGFRVAPFKSQNMALNSFVTIDGSEMGRAQVFQAEACGINPEVRMNPILLKPSADNRSQVIVMGKPTSHQDAKGYYRDYKEHWEIVKKAYDGLASDYDVIVIEGAGSPAEINLQESEIVNMKMAAYANAPVLIAGDIDRGGVFAWLKGTYDLVPDESRHRIKGFLINKFRGDRKLLDPGINMFHKIVGVDVIGVIPYFSNIKVDEEDSLFYNFNDNALSREYVTIGVVPLPRISNFTDFSAFSYERDIHLLFPANPIELEQCDCIVIPGSKSTISDAAFLEKKGWFHKIKELYNKGRLIIGVCGGFQMLGEKILDPMCIESEIRSMKGLGLLPIKTEIKRRKILKQIKFRLKQSMIFPAGCTVEGYEIHMGRIFTTGTILSLYEDDKSISGAATPDGRVIGTYLHGFFDNDKTRRALINFLREKKGFPPIKGRIVYQEIRNLQFEKLADLIRDHCDMDRIFKLTMT